MTDLQTEYRQHILDCWRDNTKPYPFREFLALTVQERIRLAGKTPQCLRPQPLAYANVKT